MDILNPRWMDVREVQLNLNPCQSSPGSLAGVNKHPTRVWALSLPGSPEMGDN